MARGVRREWTKEKIAEILKWVDENDKSIPMAAEHFGIPKGYIYSSAIKFGLRPNKRSRAELKPKPTPRKKPAFIDLTPHVETEEQITIIQCRPDQLAKVLGGIR